jgi:hypothetical protein
MLSVFSGAVVPMPTLVVVGDTEIVFVPGTQVGVWPQTGPERQNTMSTAKQAASVRTWLSKSRRAWSAVSSTDVIGVPFLGILVSLVK